MRRIWIAGLVCLIAAAGAQERRHISPIALTGEWIGGLSNPPPQCTEDGYMMNFTVPNEADVGLAVQRQAGGQRDPVVVTDYKVVPPPPGAPIAIDIFLKSDRDEIGVQILTGSKMIWIAAGPEKAYSQPQLYMRRC